MPDIATLGLAVDSREVADASKDLDRIREAAARAEKQADSFGKRVEDAGKRAAAANDNSARAADRAAKAYDGYSRAAQLAARAMGAIVGAAIGKALIDFADTWSDINARVGLAIRNMDASGAVLDRLATVARRTYSALDLTAESFVRNASVLRELGKSTAEQLDYTEALNLALVVSGARGEHAARVQDALGKAMAAGKLRGDELNTVIERGGRVAEILAEELGINQNQLRKLGSEGKITGDTIYNALTKRLEQLQEEAESMPATIGDGLMLIRNALFQTIGVFDQANGLSATFAEGLIAVADNIGRVVTYAATAVTAFGTYYVGAMVAAYVSTMTLNGALVLLRAALIRTGIGALIIGAGELIYQFGRLVSAAGGFGEAMGLVGDLVVEVWGRIKIGGQALAMELTAVAQRIKASFLDAWGAIAGAFGQMMEAIGSGYNAIASNLPGFMGDWTWDATGVSEYAKEVQRAADFTHQLSDNSRAAADKLYGEAQASLESIAAIRKVLADAAAGSGIPNTPGVRAPTVPDVDKAAQKAAKAYKQIVDGAKEFIATQELERQALGMTEQEANRLRYTQDLLNQAKRAGIKLSADQTAELHRLGRQMADTEAQTTALQRALDFGKDLVRGFVSDLRSGLEQGKGFWKSFGDAAMNVLDKIVDKLLNDVIDALFKVNQAGSGMGGGGGILGFLGGLFGGTSPSSSLWRPNTTAGAFFTNGFSSGGWTGNGAASRAAGIVHGQEFVVRAGPAAQYRPALEAINAGRGMPIANSNHANQNVRVEVEVFVNDDGTIGALARSAGRDAAVSVVQANNKARQKHYQNGGQFG